MSRKGKSKKRSQEIHSKLRALERYGVELSKNDIEAIVKLIQEGSPYARFIMKDSRRVAIWAVTYREKEFKVCYDKHQKMISTFLPPEFE